MDTTLSINGNLSLPDEQIKELQKPTLPEFIDTRPGPSGMKLSYVETGYIIAQLNKIFGHVWSYEVLREGHLANQVWCLGRLRVLLTNGTVITKEQFGSADIKFKKGTELPVSIGDDYKAAASDAMKKCASLLGLASDVYHPKLHKKVNAMREKITAQAPINPSQMAEIRKIYAELGEDVVLPATSAEATMLIAKLWDKRKALSKELDSLPS